MISQNPDTGMVVLLCLAVAAIACVLTMVGLGGGLVYSPLFLMVGMAKAEAASSALFLNLVAAASASWVYGSKRMVDYSLALPLIVTSMLTAPLGAALNGAVEVETFMCIMAAVLVLAAVRMGLGGKAGGQEGCTAAQPAPGVRLLKLGAVGAVVGVVGGLLGIGGGVFIMPLLVCVLHVPPKQAAASTAFIVCFSSLSGFAGYLSFGVVNWGFVLPAGVAAFAGGRLGARLMSERLKGAVVNRLFAAVLLLLAARLLFRALS